jgi:peptide deformylase
MIIKKSDLKVVDPDNIILCSPPTEWDFVAEPDGSMFANIMFERMKELGGVGLSANQLGVNVKMFVMGIGELRISVFNPSIVSTSAEETVGIEGCITFPGIYLNMARPSSVTAKYFNEKGEEQIVEYIGLTARIFLHEYDHMQGITLKHKASKLKWDLASGRKTKRTKKIVQKHVQKQLQNIQKQIDQNGNNT